MMLLVVIAGVTLFSSDKDQQSRPNPDLLPLANRLTSERLQFVSVSFLDPRRIAGGDEPHPDTLAPS
ncbi:hypothetical protein [Synechococcus sp. MIT S1220]|uniref:hypothetical protein n=1 Tax=Synechococcus sp. MIT S1220 TaxID=3082549 RepID=UPI0039AF8AEE